MSEREHRISTWGVMLILVVSFIVVFSVVGLWLYHLEIVQENAARLRLDPTARPRRMEMPETVVIMAFLGAVPNLAALGISWFWLGPLLLWRWMAAEVAIGAIASWVFTTSASDGPWDASYDSMLVIWLAPFVLPLVVTGGVLLSRRWRTAES